MKHEKDAASPNDTSSSCPFMHFLGILYTSKAISRALGVYSVGMDLMMSESPGSVMASTPTRKYLPQAVPMSTLSVWEHQYSMLPDGS